VLVICNESHALDVWIITFTFSNQKIAEVHSLACSWENPVVSRVQKYYNVEKDQKLLKYLGVIM
jgi:hypothetical protein